MSLDDWLDVNRPKSVPFATNQPNTDSERRLSALIKRTFLDLWSFPSIYNDKRGHATGDGKEVCDHLVVFGDTIIIFSDKEVRWKDGPPLAVCWKRWYKRAIQESLAQAVGAQRWLAEHPDRIFFDKSCQKRFPSEVFAAATKVHIVCVASGAEDAVSKFGNDGSRQLEVAWGELSDCSPFTLYSCSTSGGTAHCLDIEGLTSVVEEFDTAADFISYLNWRGEFFQRSFFSGGTENDLIAAFFTEHYLPDSHKDNSDLTIVFLDSYEDFKSRPEFIEKKRADHISYLWDHLISEFCDHVKAGTAMGAPGESSFGYTDAEKGLRFLARANRFERRILGQNVFDCLRRLKELPGSRYFRSIINEAPNQPSYVVLGTNFFFGPSGSFDDYEHARIFRGAMLQVCCNGLALRYPNAQPVVGIGLDGPSMVGLGPKGGMDIVAVDELIFDEESEKKQKEAEKHFSLFTNLRQTSTSVQEFPSPTPLPQGAPRQQRRAAERRAKKKSAKKS